MEPSIGVKHNGRELSLQTKGKLVVPVALCRPRGIPNGSNTATRVRGSDGRPALSRRMDDSHITEQGPVGQLDLNIGTQLTLLMQIRRLDAHGNIGKANEILQVVQNTMVAAGDICAALRPAA